MPDLIDLPTKLWLRVFQLGWCDLPMGRMAQVCRRFRELAETLTGQRPARQELDRRRCYHCLVPVEPLGRVYCRECRFLPIRFRVPLRALEELFLLDLDTDLARIPRAPGPAEKMPTWHFADVERSLQGRRPARDVTDARRRMEALLNPFRRTSTTARSVFLEDFERHYFENDELIWSGNLIRYKTQGDLEAERGIRTYAIVESLRRRGIDAVRVAPEHVARFVANIRAARDLPELADLEVMVGRIVRYEGLLAAQADLGIRSPLWESDYLFFTPNDQFSYSSIVFSVQPSLRVGAEYVAGLDRSGATAREVAERMVGSRDEKRLKAA